MNDEIEQQIEHVADLIREGNEPHVGEGELVTMYVGPEEHPVGVVISAYQRIAMQIADMATTAIEQSQLANRHPWSMTAQNVLLMLIVVGGLAVVWRGWPM